MIPPSTPSRVAYFSMEVALDPAMPTYSGGLGVLAGDTLRSAADLGVRVVAVSLLHRKGYFAQRLDERGNQTESPATWNPEEKLELMKPVVSVRIEGREVKVRAWRYLVEGIGGDVVPVYLLDTYLPENSPWDQTLTDHLYGGDLHYRLCQEAVLGMGGVAILPKLGHHYISSHHLSEGHAALLVLALVDQRMGGRNIREAKPDDLLAVRHKCVFTTHTPVPAGHDQFPIDMVHQVLGDDRTAALQSLNVCLDAQLNMTYLALAGSRYVDGVAMQHGEVSRHMFPSYSVRAITNGVSSFSVLDGWWVEGCLEGFTGWSIGYGPETVENEEAEAGSLYAKLEMIILPMFYGRPKAYAAIMRSAIAHNGSFFNTRRMVSQYISNAYFQNGEF